MNQKSLDLLLEEYAVVSRERLKALQVLADAEGRHVLCALVEDGVDERALLSLVASVSGGEILHFEDFEALHPAPFLLEQIPAAQSMAWGILPWRWKQDWRTLELICLARPTPAIEEALKRRTQASHFLYKFCTVSHFLKGHQLHYSSLGADQPGHSIAPDEESGGLSQDGLYASSSGSLAVMSKVLDGRWEIEKPLATGGMGSVFLARDQTNDAQVAVKFLHSEYRMDPTERQRFVLEGQILKQMRHPNIVRVLGIGVEEEIGLYSVMEYLEGCNLYEACQRLGLLTWDFVIKVFVLVCDAMEYAHKNRVLHRDLKPENIFLLGGVKTAPEVRVLDFGIAKLMDVHQELTQTGITLGTPLYIAPEQAMGLPVDIRADVYSLTAILFECLTGRPPFEFKTAYKVMGAKVAQPPPMLHEIAPHVTWPGILEDLIEQGLATRPEHRYESMSQLREDLLVCLQKIPIQELKQQRHARAMAAASDSMEIEVAWEDDAQGIFESSAPTEARPTVIPSDLIVPLPGDERDVGGAGSLPAARLGPSQAETPGKGQRFVETLEVQRIPTRPEGMKVPAKATPRPMLPAWAMEGAAGSSERIGWGPSDRWRRSSGGTARWAMLLAVIYLLVGALLVSLWSFL